MKKQQAHLRRSALRRKSRRRRPARGAAVSRNSITENKMPFHPALTGLDARFRRSADWSGPTTPPKSENLEVRMLRLANTEINPCESSYLAAIDRRSVDKEASEKCLVALADHWSACLSHIRPSPVDWHKSGGVIWDHLGLKLPPGWTEDLFGLVRADDPTVRACHAALLGAFASQVGNVELEAIHNALATFIHTHPHFADMVCEAEWHLPYGENTLYRVGRQHSEAGRKSKKKTRA